MSDQLTILRTNRLLNILQKMFERWRPYYIHIATFFTLVLASPLAIGSMSTVIFRTNLTRIQLNTLVWTLLATSVLSGLVVYAYIIFFTPTLRRFLQTETSADDMDAPLRLRTWDELALLPRRILIAIAATLFLTYILPTAAIMSVLAKATSEELTYIVLGQILAGVNLMISANLAYNLMLMPVYNEFAPVESDLPVAQVAHTSLNANLIFQSVAITSIALLIMAPRSYYQVAYLAGAAGFRVIDLANVRRTMFIITGTSLMMSLLYSALLGYITSLPGRYMMQAIARIQRGERNIRVPVLSSDENGQVAIYLNRLLNQTQSLESTLQQQVAERTASLQKRTAELQAIAEIAQQASTFDTVQELVEALVESIPQRFGFYHVGLFTIDETNGYAVLQAANSEGGRRMLARGHKLRLGEGIVGTVAQQRAPRIALDVGADAVFFNNPDLPETRSEMALPLMARGKLIGVLDIQSKEANAFSQDDVETLLTLANQAALAIENIRLLEESRQALAELQVFIQEDLRSHWAARLQEKKLAYTYTGLGVFAKGKESSQLAAAHVMRIPIELQGIRLGALQVKRSDRPWTRSEREMADVIAQQIALALESARLLEQTRQFVAREQTISNISNRMRQSLDLDAVLRTAVHELQWRLDLAEAEVQILPPDLAGGEEGQE